jgi:hypothetical protein
MMGLQLLFMGIVPHALDAFLVLRGTDVSAEDVCRSWSGLIVTADGAITAIQ